jgi:hypothetical protein
VSYHDKHRMITGDHIIMSNLDYDEILNKKKGTFTMNLLIETVFV